MDNQIFFLAIAAIGLVIGSFLNVVIIRLPQAILNQTSFPLSALWKPCWSYCARCHKKLKARDQIPVLSYLCLKGQCRYCKHRISPQYPMIELLTCLLSLVIAIRFGMSPATPAALLLVWALVALAFIDAKHLLLPDSITLPFLGLGLVINGFGIFESFSNALLGAGLGYGILWGIYWGYQSITQREGLGQGDFKCLAMLGAWLGWVVLPLILLIASLLAGVWGLSLIARRKATLQTRIPFGVFLAVGGFIILLWGQDLILTYQEVLAI